MPTFAPFRAWRYAPDVPLDAVLAPPYDVLSPADVAALQGRDPRNIVWVDIPQGSSSTRYAEAAALLSSWRSAGVLVEDPEPSYTIYRTRFVDATGAARDLAAVLGALDAGGVAAGVLPHERTTPKASTDRLDLTRATEANLSPVWGLSLAAGLSALLVAPGEVLGSVVVDGVEHVVERVTASDRVAAITAAVESESVLIADGHHRYAVAGAYAAEVGGAGGSTATLALVGELVEEQLSIAAIHRLYAGVPFSALTSALASGFSLVPFAGDDPVIDAEVLAGMTDRGALVLVGPGGARWWLVPRAGAFDGVRSLDGAWLEAVLSDVAGLEVSYQHGVGHVVDAVGSGANVAGILIRPVSIAEIERTAREGLLMPPKSTYFTPKPRTGFVLRDLR